MSQSKKSTTKNLKLREKFIAVEAQTGLCALTPEGSFEPLCGLRAGRQSEGDFGSRGPSRLRLVAPEPAPQPRN
jgi:hypothetical protein